MRLMLILLLFLFCKTIQSSPIRESALKRNRLTKERILELSPELLKDAQDYRVQIQKPLQINPDDYSLEEIMLLKNSIFAQYGRQFSTSWLQKYFNSRTWYKNDKYKFDLLTDVDRRNIDTLASVQRRREEHRRKTVKQYDPVGYVEIGGAFAETFFHLFCPNQTYVFLDYHDLTMQRGTWKKTDFSLEIALTQECKYKCLKEEPLECEVSRFLECHKPASKRGRIFDKLIDDEQFAEFIEAGSHSGNHELGWHYNFKKHAIQGKPKLCDVSYRPATFRDATKGFRNEGN